MIKRSLSASIGKITAKQIPSLDIFNLILLTLILGGGWLLFNKVSDVLDLRDHPNHLQIDQSEINTFDPYYRTKHYLPVPEKTAFMINLDQVGHDPFLEIQFSSGCYFEIVFLNGGRVIDSVEINTRKESQQVIQVPPKAGEQGYDGILIKPLYGKVYYVSYVNPLRTIEDSVLTREYPLRPAAAVNLAQVEGDPHLVNGLMAYLGEYSGQTLELVMANIGPLPIELISLSNDTDDEIINFSAGIKLAEADPANIEYRSVSLAHVPADFLKNRLGIQIQYKYSDEPAIHSAAVYPYQRRYDEEFNGTLIRVQDNTAEFKFIIKNDTTISFSGSRIKLTKPLILPPGRTVQLSAGQTIDLSNGAFILSRSPIISKGTQNMPVSFISSDGTGLGIAVLQAGSMSKFSNTTFDNLSNPVSGIWNLTGAVTFYESDVHFSNCSFLNNRSEDGLNIIRSAFVLDKVHFFNTYSDAFDSDFSTGTISDSIFEKTVNDGVDVSTSQVTITGTKFINNGDKGISGGENSQVELQNITVQGAVIGVAAKDLTQVTGQDVFISDVKIGLALYQKKPEFGPSSMVLTNTTLGGLIGLDHLIESGSTLELNNETVVPKSKKKEKLILDKLKAGEIIEW